MANQIGSTSFDVFQGNIQVSAEGVQILNRIGRDYSRTRTLGLKGKESVIRTTEFAANNAAALALVETTYPGLQGSVVTVVDSLNNSFENVTITGMQITGFKNVIQGGGAKVRVSAEWTMIAGAQS